MGEKSKIEKPKVGEEDVKKESMKKIETMGEGMEVNLEEILGEDQVGDENNLDMYPIRDDDKYYHSQICDHLRNKELVAYLLVDKEYKLEHGVDWGLKNSLRELSIEAEKSEPENENEISVEQNFKNEYLTEIAFLKAALKGHIPKPGEINKTIKVRRNWGVRDVPQILIHMLVRGNRLYQAMIEEHGEFRVEAPWGASEPHRTQYPIYVTKKMKEYLAEIDNK